MPPWKPVEIGLSGTGLRIGWRPASHALSRPTARFSGLTRATPRRINSRISPPLEITFDITRDDWIAANEALIRHSPQWKVAASEQRRALLKQALWAAPVAAIIIAWLAGRSAGMEEGIFAGIVVGLAIFIGISRLDVTTGAKKRAMDQVRRMDLGSHIGRITVAISERAVEIKDPIQELKLSWLAVVPNDLGDYMLFGHGGSGTIIPKRAFASEADAEAFARQARAWWQEGQVPAIERIARYLADRDVACPRCSYNLRGVRAEACPECGDPLTIEKLVAAKQ